MKLSKAIKQKVKKAIFMEDLAKEISTYVIKNIKGITREGKKTESGTNHKDLANSTIKNREYLEKYGNATGTAYKTKKPNLTISGQLLNSIKSKYSEKDKTITIMPMGVRKRYKGKSGSIGNIITNEKIAEYMHDMGRPFLGLSEKMRQVIFIKIKRIIARNIKK